VINIRLSKLLETYNLHDSIVEGLAYNEIERKIIVSLELCNWKQSFYSETEPELQMGVLIFTGIDFYQTEPSLLPINSNEILDVQLLASTPKSERVKIVLTGDDDVRIVVIQAEDAEWIETAS